MSKRLCGNIGCKDNTSSWDLIGFPNGSSIVNSIMSGRDPPLYCKLTGTLIAIKVYQNIDKGHDEAGYKSVMLYWVWDRVPILVNRS